MLQLLSPAGNGEAVIAAVQNGADMVYLGYGVSEGEGDLSSQELAQCLRYCRVRGCPVAVVIDGLITDETMSLAVERAVYAAEAGAAAIMVQDLGLVTVLKKVLPETPLWGGLRLNIHNADGARTAAALGLSRIVLAQSLTLEEIRDISGSAPVETAVCVHGPQCISYSGQCHMSVLEDRNRNDCCNRCSEPCRKRFSLGGRMDDAPLVMPDICYIKHLREIEDAGAVCALISGNHRPAEYVAYTTGLYARAIRENALPTPEEQAQLQALFSPDGLTDNSLSSSQETEISIPPDMNRRAKTKALADIRKGYMNGEFRRVPVTFYAVIRQGQPAVFAAEDSRGHRATYEGYVPVDLGRQGITEERVRDILFRTGGTPYYCTDVRCDVERNTDYPDEAIENARKTLLSAVTEQNRRTEAVSSQNMPPRPEGHAQEEKPAIIFQISREEQLTPSLAALCPDWLYVPAELLAAGAPETEFFRNSGTQIAAVLPQIFSQGEMPDLRELLATLKTLGIRRVLVGDISLLPCVIESGMTPWGDLGLNLTNAWAMNRLSRSGFEGLTASFQLSVGQIAALTDIAKLEMVVYGRLPVMITEKCIIRRSAGHCACSASVGMSDDHGTVYPVEKAFGCRNTVYDGKKIFLADRKQVYENAGLRGVRLLFTTENPRECVDVAGAYTGKNNYRPNNTYRGVYPKGAL